MSGCSNLDPVRRGSLIPDYGSLGLRHADAQVCTHLQFSNLSICLSALNLKPHPQKSFKVEAVATVLVPEMRCVVPGVGMLVWAIRAQLLSVFGCFSALWCYSTSVQKDLQSVDALNCLHIEGNGLVEMKVSLRRCYLSEHNWRVHQGGGGGVNKAKQTLHLYGIENHHADTYTSDKIKAGTAQNTAQARWTPNFMKMFCQSLRHS